MKFNRYDKSVPMKDSGIEWIGEIPEHWEVFRFKDFTSILSGYSPEEIQPDTNGQIPYYKVDDLNSLSTSGFICSNNWYVTRLRKKYKKEILLLPKRGMSILSNKVGITNTECLFDTNLMGLRLNCRKVKKKYIYYWILTAGLSRFADINTIPQLNNKHIYPLLIYLPRLPEQKAIAHYLDTKTAQIDRKIDLLTQKAQRYEELKRSLINETVTRGLDKSVPMKDSGIEWIGEIPEHWKVERINDIAVQQKRKNIGLKEKNLLSLSYGKIKRRDFDTSFGLLPESFETYQIIETGNIILRLTDLQNDQRSLRVGLVRERGIITSAYLCLMLLRKVHPNFAYYLLYVYDISKVFYWFGGGLRQSMKFDDIKVFPFILPPLHEQKEIAHYLDTKTTQIDQIIQTINTQIEKLKELRKTLINDIVTGKIKVV